MGIVSSIPLEFSTEATNEAVPWGDMPVVQLNNAHGLTVAYGDYIKSLKDLSGVQRVTAALEYERAIIFIQNNDEDKVGGRRRRRLRRHRSL